MKIEYIQECLVFQVLITNKLWNFISLHQSPIQPADYLIQFADNLELTLEEVTNNNLFLIVDFSGFNIKSQNWYKQNKTTAKQIK